MYVSTSGHGNAEIEVHRSDNEIQVTCYPVGRMNIYISFSMSEAEELARTILDLLEQEVLSSA